METPQNYREYLPLDTNEHTQP